MSAEMEMRPSLTTCGLASRGERSEFFLLTSRFSEVPGGVARRQTALAVSLAQ